jgi:D-alanyl-D-alanine carboxypeptidase
MRSRAILPILCAVLLLPLAAAPLHGRTGGSSVSDLIEETQHFLDELDAYHELSLAVMIAKDGVPVLQRAYGDANRSFHVPNAIDTKFNLASMNKMFTAIAVMQLVEEGALQLENTVGDYAPDFPNSTVRDSVTVYQLLTHTSGMGNIFGPVYDRTPRNRFRTASDYFPLFVQDSLRFAPGSKYEYSNAGYILLGYLVERVTGQDYHDYVREHIFAPAGMSSTDCYDVQFPVPNLAVGYTKSHLSSSGYEYKTIEFMKMTRGGPAGGGYSTVGDLVRFGEVIFDNKLLSEEYTNLTTTGKVEVDDTYQGGKYCFGFLEQVINGHRIVGHGGNLSGIRASLKVYVDDGISVAILSNFDRDLGAEELDYFIQDRLCGPTDFTRSYLATKKMVRQIAEEGWEGALHAYDGDDDPPELYEGILHQSGHDLLDSSRSDEAVELFRFYVQVFAESGYGWEGLGEAYLAAGDRDSAVRSFKAALERDPDMKRSAEALEELGEVGQPR